MVLPHLIPTLYTTILILLLQTSLEAKKSKTCPVGFQLAYSGGDDNPMCYRLKGPEKFTDTYNDCSGNLYTSKLFDNLKIPSHVDLVLWTEYKSAYPGGPFVDVSYTETTGSLLKTSFDILNSQIGIEEELCVVKEPLGNLRAVRCDQEYYRYCFVEPYPETVTNEGCEAFNGSKRFWSPKPVCLSAVTGVSGSAVRATWIQANEICEKRGGEILYTGWRYSNSPELQVYAAPTVTYPLRVTYDPTRNGTVRNAKDSVRPSATAVTDIQNAPGEILYGALNNGIWEKVNSSYVFLDLICEKEPITKEILLSVRVDDQNKLILTVNDKIDEINLYCFSDSETYYPKPVSFSFEDFYNDLLTYVIKPESDGNYWCVNIDSKRYQATQSKKVLWFEDERKLKDTYAVKLNLDKNYTLDNADKVMKFWEKKLKDYIFYSTKYYEVNGDLSRYEESKDFQDTLKQFKQLHPELSPKGKDVIKDMKIKKLYLDGTSALVHLRLDSSMKPVQPGWWNNLKVIYMKPVHFCSIEGRQFVNTLTIGCEIHSCVGNFVEGVQVVTQSDKICMFTSISSPLNASVTFSVPTMATLMPNISKNSTKNNMLRDLSSSEEIEIITTTEAYSTTEVVSSTRRPTTVATTIPPPPTPPADTVITAVPTFPTTAEAPITTTEPPTIPPDEHLQQVLDNLEQLINNTEAVVSVDGIAEPFDRVDELLEENVDLEIPGQLLHLLDQIGNRLDLNGSDSAKTVRSNVALLVASAEPGMPVNGLRIAARENDTFALDDFEIIRDPLDSNHLSSEASEAVVHLPNSVANSTRRISFVVFRNDRAFRNNNTAKSVNSRILSINVENITQFRTGEAIDIHFSPLVGEPDRNQSRSCAYWQFDEFDGGYWSQEGCTFIPASGSGMLDTCQCTHLTHFAEILISRDVFSEQDELILEYLSVIGCCLSIFGLTMVTLTATLFRSWRRDFNNKIWLQLSLSILLLIICFLVVVFVKFSTYNPGCMFTGILLHYSVLASFCWMLVAAVLSYRRLVMVFTRDASHKLLRASAFAWGAPLAVIGILLSVAPESYQGQFETMTPSGSFCYPSGLGLWLAVYTPIAVMLVANWVLFVLIVRSVFASRRIQRHGDSNEAVRCASVSCLLVFLFGLPWIFGLFAFNVVAAYFFTITSTFQGFVLFIFFVVGNKKTRDLWLNKLKIKQTLKVPVTSSTYTNRSTGGPGWRGGVSGTVEAKLSKPRSLANSDDSRFS